MRSLDETHLDHTLLALADPTRRAILRQLASGAARVTDLAAPFDMSLNAVSKHIKMLERARLVRRQVIGREHRVALDPAPLDAVAAWIGAQRAFWNARLGKLESLLVQRRVSAPRAKRSGRRQHRAHD
jgi:DNA-binding transcriptional ArsR family regulator